MRSAARAAGLPAELAEAIAVYPPVPSAGGRAVVACDLDRTLIYSADALALRGTDADAPRLTVAEVHRGAPTSFCTREAEVMTEVLATRAVFVPVTTRTRAQYARVRLPGLPPRYAVTTNGARILVDGREDDDWSRAVAARLAGSCAPIGEVAAHLDKAADRRWSGRRRDAEGAFCYVLVDRAQMPACFLTELTRWCAARGWRVSVQGRKVYAVPEPLTKAAAVAEVARRCGATRTLAAGDSLLDADLLADADFAVRPAHGELHDSRWHRPNLTVTQAAGVLGGQEVIARLLAFVLAAG